MAMDPDFQFAYWSALVQQEQIETHETAWRPWVPASDSSINLSTNSFEI